jgi:hypothetical protein
VDELVPAALGLVPEVAEASNNVFDPVQREGLCVALDVLRDPSKQRVQATLSVSFAAKPNSQVTPASEANLGDEAAEEGVSLKPRCRVQPDADLLRPAPSLRSHSVEVITYY